MLSEAEKVKRRIARSQKYADDNASSKLMRNSDEMVSYVSSRKTYADIANIAAKKAPRRNTPHKPRTTQPNHTMPLYSGDTPPWD